MKTASTIAAKFLRGQSHSDLTRLWKESSENIKNAISKAIIFNTDEIPIITFSHNTNYWWVLTNQRLIIMDSQTLIKIDFKEIEAVEVKKIIEGSISKLECSSIQLKINNSYMDIELEKGTWPNMFNIFRFVINR